jgi:hypothetical protein
VLDEQGIRRVAGPGGHGGDPGTEQDDPGNEQKGRGAS